jgi:hypothetical protein
MKVNPSTKLVKAAVRRARSATPHERTRSDVGVLGEALLRERIEHKRLLRDAWLAGARCALSRVRKDTALEIFDANPHAKGARR